MKYSMTCVRPTAKDGMTRFPPRSSVLRMIRASKLARVPKRKRKRPLDVRSLMDFSLLKTMAIPLILALLIYNRAQGILSKRILVSVLLFIKGEAPGP